MDKINWAQKLSSRKFWALLTGLTIAILISFNASPDSLEKIVAVIGAFGSIFTYMYCEASIDATATYTKDSEKND